MIGYLKKSCSMLGKLRVGNGYASPGQHENLLAQVQLAPTESAIQTQPSRCWPLGLPLLNAQTACERWFVNGSVDDVAIDDFSGSNSQSWAWLGRHCALAEDDDIGETTRQLFLQLHAAARTLGKSHVVRLWIIVPQIHAGDGDNERYKRFCSGRHQAYAQLGIRAPDFPAATVIGSAQGPVRLHALLCSQAGQAVENPQQTSAYDYPRNYGPDSPSFSRALQLDQHFFVSGTAAIRGSDSQYAGDVAAQLDAIDGNLQALCRNANNQCLWPEQARYGRIYLRDAALAPQLTQHLQQHWPHAAAWPILQGDICRQELLCEVETGL